MSERVHYLQGIKPLQKLVYLQYFKTIMKGVRVGRWVWINLALRYLRMTVPNKRQFIQIPMTIVTESSYFVQTSSVDLNLQPRDRTTCCASEPITITRISL